MANSVDPDQTAPDLCLHCLPRPVCPKTKDPYSISQILTSKTFHLKKEKEIDIYS